MKYRVEVGIKNMEKREKIHILDIFGSCVPVHPVLFSQFRPVFIFWP